MIASKKSASESTKSLFHLSPSIPLCTRCAGRMIFVALLAFSASFEGLLETNHQISSGFESTVYVGIIFLSGVSHFSSPTRVMHLLGRTAGFSCGSFALSLGLCEGFTNTTGWEMELTFWIEHCLFGYNTWSYILLYDY